MRFPHIHTLSHRLNRTQHRAHRVYLTVRLAARPFSINFNLEIFTRACWYVQFKSPLSSTEHKKRKNKLISNIINYGSNENIVFVRRRSECEVSLRKLKKKNTVQLRLLLLLVLLVLSLIVRGDLSACDARTVKRHKRQERTNSEKKKRKEFGHPVFSGIVNKYTIVICAQWISMKIK